VNKEFSIDELVELRGDLSYAVQKIEKIIIGQLSAQHREKNPAAYTAEDLATAKKELGVAQFQLRTVSDKMLPAIMAIAQEAVPV
jgi:hypothetical protein